MLDKIDALSHAEYVRATYRPLIADKEIGRRTPDRGLQSHRLEVVFNNLVQGVCIFDGARNLVLANRRYAEIYSLPLESIRPGTSFAEIAARRFAAGAFPNIALDEYLTWRAEIQLQGLPSDTVVKQRNGRIISIRRRPMPDQGWVSAHEDITERTKTSRNDQICNPNDSKPHRGLMNRP